MAEIILHHYPLSPVAEKIRTAFGIKGTNWRSVEHNRLPDRPELFAMTGGYRRIPVMQIGADIYCDTQCIFRELERRQPEPSLMPPGQSGLAYALSRWTDGPLFEIAFCAAFAPVRDKLPAALIADRSRLYLGPAGDLEREAEDLPHRFAQLRAHLGLVEDELSDGRAFLAGDEARLPDLLVWTIVWFQRARLASYDALLGDFAHLAAWEARMKAIGHGPSTPMTPAEALAVAAAAEPQAAEGVDPHDPQGLTPGLMVGVVPGTDSGDPVVTGTLRAATRTEIVLLREDPACGRVAVHFPRVGYRVLPS